ncbi:hypothetical protein N8985_03185 [Glaciecola sp.]|jgi:hypothetical protein|nr:hypothetical protein [Glaciecola sp.]
MPSQFTRLLSISTLTQLADEIVSAKIVLPWILLSLNAPLWMLALIVPIKESGALLPQWSVQKILAAKFSTATIWRTGMVMQGAALFAIAAGMWWLVAASFAAYLVLLAVVVLSLGRALCSFTIKDIQAHNVEKGRRGKLIGAGGSAAGLVTILVALLLWQYSAASAVIGSETPEQTVLVVLVIAGCLCYGLGLWLSLYLSMPEPIVPEPNTPSGVSVGSVPSLGLWRYVTYESDLRELIISRVLLMHGAIVLPLMVLLIAERYAGISSLALVMLTSAIASFVSSYIWGWFSDYSARTTLAIAAAGCMLSLGWLLTPWGLAELYTAGAGFLLMNLCYSGIRTARKTYLIDMVSHTKRQRYVAAGNTIVGCALLLLGSAYAGLFSIDYEGIKVWVIGWCALMLCLGMLHTRRLRYDSPSDE